MTKAYAQFPVTIVMHEDVNLLGEVVVKGIARHINYC